MKPNILRAALPLFLPLSLAFAPATPPPPQPAPPSPPQAPAIHPPRTWGFGKKGGKAPAAPGGKAGGKEAPKDPLAPDWSREADAGKLPESVVAKDDGIHIKTRAGTWERVKIATTDRAFGAGTYTWRVHVPAMGKGDMASVGAFIYRDDKHEVDFEVGYGKADLRRKLKTADDELVCYCTNQGFPYGTSQVNLKADAWYTFAIELVPRKDGNLTIRWTIDGRKVKELESQMPATTLFGIHCSVENLKFLGDHQPTRDHEAVFGGVSFAPPGKQAEKPAGK